MARDVRFIVLTAHEDFGKEARGLLLRFPDVKILAEVEEPALLAQAVIQFPVDVLLVDLDPSPEAILPVIADIISAHSDLAVFATSESTDGQLILKLMRSGIREFLPKPIDPGTLTEAIERVANQRVDAASHGKLIAVTAASGGAGATVLATNLAVELAQIVRGKVTVVDLDYRFGQVATLLDVDPQYTVADLCSSGERLEPAVIDRALVKHSTGVYVLSRPSNPAQADTLTASSCVGLLTTLLQMNAYVIADGPNRFDLGARSVLDLSDHMLLVTQLLVPHVRNALRVIDGLRGSGYSETRMKLICNRVGRDSGNLSVGDVGETLGLPLFASIPDDWNVVSAAINLGEPLFTHGPKSKARLAIQEIAERLHTATGDADDKEAKKKGFIGRIFAST